MPHNKNHNAQDEEGFVDKTQDCKGQIKLANCDANLSPTRDAFRDPNESDASGDAENYETETGFLESIHIIIIHLIGLLSRISPRCNLSRFVLIKRIAFVISSAFSGRFACNKII